MALTRKQMTEIAHRHAQAETDGNINAIMATMEPTPLYEFYPAGLKFSGDENTRRWYMVFVNEFRPKVSGFAMHNEWINDGSVAQEFSVTLSDGDGMKDHRVVGILKFGKHGIVGERIHASEDFLRILAGSMWDALVTI